MANKYKASLKKIFKVAIFTLIGLSILAAGFYIGDYFSGKKWSKKLGQVEERERIKDIKEIYPSLEAGQTPTEYTGWQTYDWKEFGTKISYPSKWKTELKANKLFFITPDGGYQLAIELSQNGAADLSALLPQMGTAKPSGKIAIMGSSVEKYKVIRGDKSIAYAYPQKAVEIKNLSFQAVFAPKNDQSGLDVEELDSKAIAEKILRSLER